MISNEVNRVCTYIVIVFTKIDFYLSKGIVQCIRLTKFPSFYEEVIDAQRFSFGIIFTYDRFCSVEINTATFHRLGFTFV